MSSQFRSKLMEETVSVTTSDTAQLVNNEEPSTSNYTQLNRSVTYQVSILLISLCFLILHCVITFERAS